VALPVSFYSKTLADNTINSKTGKPETTTFEVAVTTLTAANVVAQQGLQTDFAVAVAGITLGVANKATLIYDREQGVPGPSSNKYAQRENKWLCRYHDNSTYQNMTVSIGTADLAQLPATNTEFLDLTTGVGNDFKVAFEAFVKSNYDPTHSVTLDSVQFVGRNS